MGATALDLVYPRACEGCGESMDAAGYLCWDCLRQTEKVTRPYCEKCGDPVDGLVEGSYECSWCNRNRPQFEAARSVFMYRGPVMDMVHQLKYSGGVHLVNDMGEIMAGAAKSTFAGVRFDVAIGVPLYARRERERGYNQAGVLASSIARKMGLECFNRAIARCRDTSSQTELKASDRARNVRGAFRSDYSDWLFSKHVLLVDDVMTTGATVDEVSRILKQAGAASVHVISFARG